MIFIPQPQPWPEHKINSVILGLYVWLSDYLFENGISTAKTINEKGMKQRFIFPKQYYYSLAHGIW